MSAPLTVQPRCPSCWAPTEGDKCGLGCDIKRCDDCRELYAVAEGHECATPCADCGDPCVPGEGCRCLEPYCAACFVLHCASCRADMADAMAEARDER